MSEPQQSEKVILNAALRLPAEERTVYLEKSCGADSQMRQRVASLLETHPPTRTSGPSGPSDTLVMDNDATITATSEIGVLSSEEAPGDVIGRYKLVEKIGEGGFGMVYMAEQTEPVQRNVALKIIKMGMDTRQVVARFEAERQALALMDHPNIAKVLDAGATDTGRPFFVMEFVRGTKITEYCDRNKLSTGKRLDLFILVCRAIEHAHQKGIIHRDIKPSNILVTLNDGAAVPKVIDFGIAKATQGHLTEKTVHTQFDQFIGTPAYMSPEQAEAGGLDIDTRSDIYSLGVLLYELLTGETPLESKNLLSRGYDEMRRLIQEWEPQRPSIRLDKQKAEEQTTTAKRHGTDAPKLIKMVRGDLDWVVMKCLEKDRARRYDTAAQLTAEIQRFLANEPVMARPPSNLYRFKKLVRRNRLVFAAGSVILAALIAGLCVTSWFVIKEKQARDAAEQASQNSERDLKIAVSERAKAERALTRENEAHQKSAADQQLTTAAEQKAQASQKAAATARLQAEAALQQAREDRDKATLAIKESGEAQAQTQTARQQAVDAETRTAAATALRSQAETARERSEAALQQATAARQQAEASAIKYRQETAAIWDAILPARLETLPPAVALQASEAIFPPADMQQPWPASILRQRGNWLARMGEWTNAIADFSKALDLEPANVKSYDALAALLAQSGQWEALSRHGARFLARFGGTNDPAIARLVATDCLFAPLSGVDIGAVAALARRSNDQLIMGLAEYRQGHYAVAADWLGKALAGSGQDAAREAQACAALAMAQQQLKQPDNARATLAKGAQIVDAKLPKLESGDIGPGWTQWIMARVLMREAAALINTPPAVK
jgi:serine/threonine protein kinase